MGLPIIAVAGSALALVAAVRSRGKPARGSRAEGVFAVLVWLKLAGDSALGDQRPAFERQWKGATAVLFAAAAAVHLWRRYHRLDPAPSEPVPAARDQPTPMASADTSAVHQVTMPGLGADDFEATVSRWLKQVGDRVAPGEPLVEISTDKADVEIPADTSGHLREIRVLAGTTVPAGSIIALIEPSAAVAS